MYNIYIYIYIYDLYAGMYVKEEKHMCVWFIHGYVNCACGFHQRLGVELSGMLREVGNICALGNLLNFIHPLRPSVRRCVDRIVTQSDGARFVCERSAKARICDAIAAHGRVR